MGDHVRKINTKLILLAIISVINIGCTVRLINVPGEATGASNATNLDVTVEYSSNITSYKFRLAPSDSPDADCSENSESYGPSLTPGTHLIKDFANMPDGDLVLCVRVTGTYLFNGATQIGSLSTTARWTKDTVAPAEFLVTGPAGVQATATPTITWSAAEGAANYTVNITSDAACENIYKSYSNILEPSFTITEGIANGFWHICVTAQDLASNSRQASNNGLLMTVDGPFQYLFATSSTFTGSQIGSLENADDICTLNAFIGNLIPDWNGIDRTYRAVLSTSSVNAKDRVVTDRSIFNRNNQLITFGSGLWTGVLVNAVQYDENGSLIGSAPVWSGSNSDGTFAADHCSDWTSDAGLGATGLSDKNDATFISNESLGCSTPQRLYCLGPVAN
jgi:hypothetical protein